METAIYYRNIIRRIITMDFNTLLEKFNISDHFNLDAFSMDKFSDLAKDSLESIRKINEATAARTEQLFKLSSEILNESVEGSITHIRSLSDIKNPEDFISTQVSFTKDLGQKAMENSQKYADFFTEANTEIGSLIQDSMPKK